MGTAAYKLAKAIDGRSHYAEVTATAEFGGGHAITVSPTAFAWLLLLYEYFWWIVIAVPPGFPIPPDPA